MSPALEAAGWAAVAVTVLGALAGLIYNAGRHAQRLNTAEKDIGKLQATQEEHAKALGSLDQFMDLLREVRDDVKGLLTGRIRPARRTASED